MTKNSIYYTVDASIIKRCSESFVMSNNQLTQASVKRLFEENEMLRPFIKKYGLRRLRIKRKSERNLYKTFYMACGLCNTFYEII